MYEDRYIYNNMMYDCLYRVVTERLNNIKQK